MIPSHSTTALLSLMKGEAISRKTINNETMVSIDESSTDKWKEESRVWSSNETKAAGGIQRESFRRNCFLKQAGRKVGGMGQPGCQNPSETRTSTSGRKGGGLSVAARDAICYKDYFQSKPLECFVCCELFTMPLV